MSGKILVVDDERIQRDIVKDILEDEGYEVLTSGSGPEALEQIRRSFVDVVLSDLRMPGMDGVETTLRIHQVHQRLGVQVPIIAMSAHIFPQEVESYLDAGLDGFVGKPIEPDRLNELLLGVSQAQEKLVSMPKISAIHLVNEKLLNDDLSVLGQACMKDMVSLFDQACIDNLAAIEVARLAQDWVKLSDLAHNFKNASGSLGLETLHQLVNQLENQAKHGQPTSIDLILEDLPSLIKNSQKALNNWRAAHLN